jgi:hypothetical protein
VPIAFAVGYGAPLTASLFLTGERWIAYGVCFLAGWAVHFTALTIIKDEPLWPAFAVTAACYPLLWWGLTRSLARLHTWETEWAAKVFVAFNGLSTASPQPTPLGWPFASLPLRRKERSWDFGDEIVISVMGGWWVYAAHFSDILSQLLLQMLFTAPFLMAGCFWIVCRPPISLWGRLRQGRLLLPRYDRCYVWPFAMCILQWSWVSLAFDLDVSLPVLTAVQVALFIACAFRAIQAFEAFQLTGGHRIPLPLGVSSNKQLFTTA